MNEIRYPFLDLRAVNAPYFDLLTSTAKSEIESGRYIGGQTIADFNRRLAEVCGAETAVGVSNGLDALRLIFEGYKLMGRLHEGDEVIVAANTYIASILAISHAGLRPVPVDPDESTFNLSARGIEHAISDRTRAILIVDFYGRINWNKDIKRLAEQYSLLVVEDAAQAIGARSNTPGLFGSDKAGAIGHAGAFSFYPTKNVGALGDGGAVVTHDPMLAQTVAALANYGSDRRYHNLYQGFNCRLDPMQAAFISLKLNDLQQISERRRKRAEAYNRLINNDLVIKPSMPTDRNESVWHQYVVRVDGCRRQQFIDHLIAHGVGWDIHYPTPPHKQPCYAEEFAGISFPIAERLADECVSLPIADPLTVADIAEIATIINSFK